MKQIEDLPLDNDQLITPTAARIIYRKLIGKRLRMAVFQAAMNTSPHLAYWSRPSNDNHRELLGVRKKRWVYFIQARAALNGGENIFNSPGEF